MTRRQIREHILRLLFNLTARDESEREEQSALYFEQVPDEEITNPPLAASPEEREYIGEKTEKIIALLPEIDDRLNRSARGWTTKRMGRADLAVLRLAVYELFYDDDIPPKVAVNEAVELAKQYGEDETPAFVNGVLSGLIAGDGGKEA